jgi:hypothetical protein
MMLRRPIPFHIFRKFLYYSEEKNSEKQKSSRLGQKKRNFAAVSAAPEVKEIILDTDGISFGQGLPNLPNTSAPDDSLVVSSTRILCTAYRIILSKNITVLYSWVITASAIIITLPQSSLSVIARLGTNESTKYNIFQWPGLVLHCYGSQIFITHNTHQELFSLTIPVKFDIV